MASADKLVEEPEADVYDLNRHSRQPDRTAPALRLRAGRELVPERSVSRIAPMAPDAGDTWLGQWPRPTRLLLHSEPINPSIRRSSVYRLIY